MEEVCTSWLWDITGWSSRLQENFWSFRGIYRMYPDSIKKNQSMSTCNQLDLETLGYGPIMPKTLFGLCLWGSVWIYAACVAAGSTFNSDCNKIHIKVSVIGYNIVLKVCEAYNDHFQLHIHFWPLHCLIQLAIVDREDCRFNCENRSWDVKVMRG